MSGCDSRQPHKFVVRRAPACAAESPKLSPRGAAPRRRAKYSGVVADKQCTCPASKLMWERYPPTPPAFARRARLPRRSEAKAGDTATSLRATARHANFPLRETRPKYREKPHKLLQVGVTPTPASKRNDAGGNPVGSTIAR